MPKARKDISGKRVERETCAVCGKDYDKGVPHMMFCQGFKGSAECEECGQEADAFKCAYCGRISCANCGDADARLCSHCKD